MCLGDFGKIRFLQKNDVGNYIIDPINEKMESGHVTSDTENASSEASNNETNDFWWYNNFTVTLCNTMMYRYNQEQKAIYNRHPNSVIILSGIMKKKASTIL